MNKSSGILLVDKPEGLSSAAVVALIKKHFQLDKIGHGGTLDPFATGLLVLLLGEATKIARFLLEGDKTYEATARLGVEMDTGDLHGNPLEEMSGPEISLATWQSLSTKFVGKIQQIPPQYSAIKHKGKPLYDYAREGKKIELQPREVEIRSLEILSAGPEEMQFRVRCGGGTYIRSLASDLARAAGTRAHLTILRRLSCGKFSLDCAMGLAALENISIGDLPLLPLQEALRHLPQVLCNAAEADLVRHGNLSVFRTIEKRFQAEGYFLLLVENEKKEPCPLAIVAAHPQLQCAYTLERVFDSSRL